MFGRNLFDFGIFADEVVTLSREHRRVLIHKVAALEVALNELMEKTSTAQVDQSQV